MAKSDRMKELEELLRMVHFHRRKTYLLTSWQPSKWKGRREQFASLKMEMHSALYRMAGAN